jgi:hypothetical protein
MRERSVPPRTTPSPRHTQAHANLVLATRLTGPTEPATATPRAGGGAGGAPPPRVGGGGGGGGAPGQSAAAQRPVAASDRGLCSRFQV